MQDYSSVSNGQTISADNNFLIEIGQGMWQLHVRANSDPVVEAHPDGLNYTVAFAGARKLPADHLVVDSIETIAVGWAAEDRCWHLGLLLGAAASVDRGSRWCGLARWTDPTAFIEMTSAETAGRALADILKKPFKLMTEQTAIVRSTTPSSPAINAVTSFPLSSSTASTDSYAALNMTAGTIPDVKLAQPPINIGSWSLITSPNGLVWGHSRAWYLETAGRILVFVILTLLFLVLSISSLQTHFAPVQPDWLPIVGFVVAAVLALNVIYQLLVMLSAFHIEFDTRLRTVRFVRRLSGVAKQIPFEKIEYLLLSQVPLRHERVKGAPADSPIEQVFFENWLHLAREKGDFVEISHLLSEGRALHPLLKTTRRRLNIEEFDTPFHQSARLIGELLGLVVWVESRG